MATLITVSGNDTLVIVFDKISTIQKIDRNNFFNIRLGIDDDIKIYGFANAVDRDSVFDQLVAMFTSIDIVSQQPPLILPTLYIGGNF